MTVCGERISLKVLREDDVNESYVKWMSDKEITQYLESRWTTYSLDDLREYAKNMNDSENNVLFGVYINDTNEYIGNIKIGDIDNHHKYGDIGLIIGEKSAWGKGFGAEAISLATDYAFKELGLNKVTAGMYENNQGSYRAFLKVGFEEIGRKKRHRMSHGKYVDELLVEKLNPDL